MCSPTPKDLVCKNSTIPAFAGYSSSFTSSAAMAPGPSADSAPGPSADSAPAPLSSLFSSLLSSSPPPITLAQAGGPPEGLGVFKAENLLAIRTKDGFSTSHYKDGVLEGELGQYLSHECSDEGEHLWRLLHA